MSNFKVTITEAVPDTGLFTSTDNSSGIAIGAGALILLFAAITIVAVIVAKRRNHRNYQKSKFHLRAAKRTMVGLSVLAVMVGAFSLAIARQPESAGDIRSNMIVIGALVEGVALFGVIVCLLTLFV